MKLAIALFLAACTTQPPAVHLIDPDAAVMPDASGCCALEPDRESVQACFDAQDTTPGVCLLYVCPSGDGGFDRFGVCNPKAHDAGVDAELDATAR